MSSHKAILSDKWADLTDAMELKKNSQYAISNASSHVMYLFVANTKPEEKIKGIPLVPNDTHLIKQDEEHVQSIAPFSAGATLVVTEVGTSQSGEPTSVIPSRKLAPEGEQPLPYEYVPKSGGTFTGDVNFEKELTRNNERVAVKSDLKPYLKKSGGTIDGDLNVTQNLKEGGQPVALKADIPTNYVPDNRKINGKTLDQNITLKAENIPNVVNESQFITDFEKTLNNDQIPGAAATKEYIKNQTNGITPSQLVQKVDSSSKNNHAASAKAIYNAIISQAKGIKPSELKQTIDSNSQSNTAASTKAIYDFTKNSYVNKTFRVNDYKLDGDNIFLDAADVGAIATTKMIYNIDSDSVNNATVASTLAMYNFVKSQAKGIKPSELKQDIKKSSKTDTAASTKAIYDYVQSATSNSVYKLKMDEPFEKVVTNGDHSISTEWGDKIENAVDKFDSEGVWITYSGDSKTADINLYCQILAVDDDIEISPMIEQGKSIDNLSTTLGDKHKINKGETQNISVSIYDLDLQKPHHFKVSFKVHNTPKTKTIQINSAFISIPVKKSGQSITPADLVDDIEQKGDSQTAPSSLAVLNYAKRKFVESTRKINGRELTQDMRLNADDVGAVDVTKKVTDLKTNVSNDQIPGAEAVKTYIDYKLKNKKGNANIATVNNLSESQNESEIPTVGAVQEALKGLHLSPFRIRKRRSEDYSVHISGGDNPTSLIDTNKTRWDSSKLFTPTDNVIYYNSTEEMTPEITLRLAFTPDQSSHFIAQIRVIKSSNDESEVSGTYHVKAANTQSVKLFTDDLMLEKGDKLVFELKQISGEQATVKCKISDFKVKVSDT